MRSGDLAKSVLALLVLALLAAAAGPAAAQEGGGSFRAFVEGLWPAAQSQGVSRATFDSAMGGLEPDPSLRGSGPAQSEFLKPMKDYVAEAASPGRVGRGKAALARWSAVLQPIAARTGVPPEMVVALWGLESDYGAAMGQKDVLRSLATLAWVRGPGNAFFDEVVAALVMLEKGLATRDQLRGSWAGAMGHPQFMPSTYLAHAASASGAGPADIWSSVPDSLASIAHFLQQSGWKPEEPWISAVKVPPGFDHAALRQPAPAFSRQGLRRLDGFPAGGSGEAMLFYPAGASGPAFLLHENFFVLKAYNFSDNYAMAASVLADRIAGREQLRVPWPAEAAPLRAAERLRLQQALKALGFYKGVPDGRFGPVTRDAVHAWQRSAGLSPADGHPSRAALERLDAALAGR